MLCFELDYAFISRLQEYACLTSGRDFLLIFNIKGNKPLKSESTHTHNDIKLIDNIYTHIYNQEHEKLTQQPCFNPTNDETQLKPPNCKKHRFSWTFADAEVHENLRFFLASIKVFFSHKGWLVVFGRINIMHDHCQWRVTIFKDVRTEQKLEYNKMVSANTGNFYKNQNRVSHSIISTIELQKS